MATPRARTVAAVLGIVAVVVVAGSLDPTTVSGLYCWLFPERNLVGEWVWMYSEDEVVSFETLRVYETIEFRRDGTFTDDLEGPSGCEGTFAITRDTLRLDHDHGPLRQESVPAQDRFKRRDLLVLTYSSGPKCFLRRNVGL